MRSLFWKIFGWFWGAMVLIGLALYLVVLTARPDPMPAPWRESAAQTMTAYASSATQQFESNGQRGLREYLAKIGQSSFSHFWLFDGSGRELSGFPIPPPGPDQRLLPPPDDEPPPPPDSPRNSRRRRRHRGPIESPERVDFVRRRAGQNDAAIFENFKPRILVGQRVRAASGRTYVLVGSLLEPRFARQIADPRHQILGGVLLLGLSLLVCYGLVRYLTSPLIELREATRRLSEGDLSARTGAGQKKRRDEVADLGRDFDAMAARIETLMTSQRRLLGDVSHELRSPLARLSMALGLARRHAESGASLELVEDFNRIGREKERLNELIGQLLELVRLESGENPAPRERIELEELVREIAEDAAFEARAAGKGVLVARAERCHVFGARELLQSAIENVVRNALAYTAPATIVEINLAVEADYSVLRVRDRGAGVPDDAVMKIFEPFYRVASARDRQSGGVGLGLAITQRAVASHGGSIVARNVPENGGLEIEMRLPLAPSTLVPTGEAAA